MTTAPIDTRKPITIVDDRGRADEDLMVSRVLFENEQVILVEAVAYLFDRQGLFKVTDPAPVHLLIARDNGEVQNSAYDAWIAENPADTRVPAPALGVLPVA